MIYTPDGRIFHLEQIAGNRHDVNGLYALLNTDFKGRLVGDAGYLPKQEKREELERKEIRIVAAKRKNMKKKQSKEDRQLLSERFHIERRISLFDSQFHADKTRCRSEKHYRARRWMKALAHNLSRHINGRYNLPFESVAHFKCVA